MSLKYVDNNMDIKFIAGKADTSIDNATIVRNANNELSVPIDNSSIKLVNGKISCDTTSIDQRTAAIEGNISENGKDFIFGYRDGKYGYYTNNTRGADTFIPFSKANATLLYIYKKVFPCVRALTDYISIVAIMTEYNVPNIINQLAEDSSHWEYWGVHDTSVSMFTKTLDRAWNTGDMWLAGRDAVADDTYVQISGFDTNMYPEKAMFVYANTNSKSYRAKIQGYSARTDTWTDISNEFEFPVAPQTTSQESANTIYVDINPNYKNSGFSKIRTQFIGDDILNKVNEYGLFVAQWDLLIHV